MTISEKIIKLRKEKGWSQDKLAEELDVSRQSVSKWESDKALPDTDKILQMSQIFGVTTDFLLKDDEGFANPADTVEEEPSAEKTEEIAEEEKPVKKNTLKKVIAVIATVCILAAAIIPIPLGGYTKLLAKIAEEPVEYPYILVHGLGGWGSEAQINEIAPYWGSSTGNLSAFLTQQGYTVKEASIGPFSSTWDRTCELYAQLTGTTVDYGEAHSKKHNHKRFGKKYTEPIIEGWGTKTPKGQIIKANLIGHSFGGETVRMLTSLLEYGDSEEQKSGCENLSPLFTGDKGNWINSVTTLCSPHNGSTLFYVVDQYKLVNSILGAIYLAGNAADTTTLDSFYDFRLEQFGLKSGDDKETAASVINTVFSNGTDNAAYDLSPDGAEELNKTVKTVDSVYYFSYSFSTTHESTLSGKQVPDKNTLLILQPTALLMGRYSQNNVSDFSIDETWLENDGLVNVVSAKYPFTDSWQEFDSENIVKGKWNVMPTMRGHHGTIIGMDKNTEEIHNFYTELIERINSLPRDKKFYF